MLITDRTVRWSIECPKGSRQSNGALLASGLLGGSIDVLGCLSLQVKVYSWGDMDSGLPRSHRWSLDVANSVLGLVIRLHGFSPYRFNRYESLKGSYPPSFIPPLSSCIAWILLQSTD